MIMEYIPYGNLRDFLTHYSKKLQDDTDDEYIPIPAIILGSNKLVQCARDVAYGMDFLTTQQVSTCKQ